MVAFILGYFLKGSKGATMETGDLGSAGFKVCFIKACTRYAGPNKRGLCLVCYSRAKKRVDSGEVTWDRLVDLGLCKADADNPFDDAYSRAMEDQ